MKRGAPRTRGELDFFRFDCREDEGRRLVRFDFFTAGVTTGMHWAVDALQPAGTCLTRRMAGSFLRGPQPRVPGSCALGKLLFAGAANRGQGFGRARRRQPRLRQSDSFDGLTPGSGRSTVRRRGLEAQFGAGSRVVALGLATDLLVAGGAMTVHSDE